MNPLVEEAGDAQEHDAEDAGAAPSFSSVQYFLVR
jgi:hypothetical protein